MTCENTKTQNFTPCFQNHIEICGHDCDIVLHQSLELVVPETATLLTGELVTEEICWIGSLKIAPNNNIYRTCLYSIIFYICTECFWTVRIGNSYELLMVVQRRSDWNFRKNYGNPGESSRWKRSKSLCFHCHPCHYKIQVWVRASLKSPQTSYKSNMILKIGSHCAFLHFIHIYIYIIHDHFVYFKPRCTPKDASRFTTMVLASFTMKGVSSRLHGLTQKPVVFWNSFQHLSQGGFLHVYVQ